MSSPVSFCETQGETSSRCVPADNSSRKKTTVHFLFVAISQRCRLSPFHFVATGQRFPAVRFNLVATSPLASSHCHFYMRHSGNHLITLAMQIIVRGRKRTTIIQTQFRITMRYLYKCYLKKKIHKTTKTSESRGQLPFSGLAT